jgi:hypothetical protein
MGCSASVNQNFDNNDPIAPSNSPFTSNNIAETSSTNNSTQKDNTVVDDVDQNAPDLLVTEDSVAPPIREGTLEILTGNRILTTAENSTPVGESTPVPIREGTLDILMQRTSDDEVKTILLPLETLEDLIVDESVDLKATLEKVQSVVSNYSSDIQKLFANCRGEEDIISIETWTKWSSRLDADIDADTAKNQFNEVCGFSVEEGGESPPKLMTLELFACCLVRIANLYTIQNKGNPMDSDIPSQIVTFWKECKGLQNIL